MYKAHNVHSITATGHWLNGGGGQDRILKATTSLSPPDKVHYNNRMLLLQASGPELIRNTSHI